MKDTTRTFIIVATVLTVMALIKTSNAHANPNAFYLSCEGTATETLKDFRKDTEGQYSGKKNSYKIQGTYAVQTNRVERKMTDQVTWSYKNQSGQPQEIFFKDQVIQFNDRYGENTINRLNGDWAVDERLPFRRLQVTGTCRKAERAF